MLVNINSSMGRGFVKTALPVNSKKYQEANTAGAVHMGSTLLEMGHGHASSVLPENFKTNKGLLTARAAPLVASLLRERATAQHAGQVCSQWIQPQQHAKPARPAPLPTLGHPLVQPIAKCVFLANIRRYQAWNVVMTV
jgi:hypothetical protein